MNRAARLAVLAASVTVGGCAWGPPAAPPVAMPPIVDPGQAAVPGDSAATGQKGIPALPPLVGQGEPGLTGAPAAPLPPQPPGPGEVAAGAPPPAASLPQSGGGTGASAGSAPGPIAPADAAGAAALPADPASSLTVATPGVPTSPAAGESTAGAAPTPAPRPLADAEIAALEQGVAALMGAPFQARLETLSGSARLAPLEAHAQLQALSGEIAQSIGAPLGAEIDRLRSSIAGVAPDQPERAARVLAQIRALDEKAIQERLRQIHADVVQAMQRAFEAGAARAADSVNTDDLARR